MVNCNTLGKGACVWVPTEDEYFLLQIHLHWGSDNTKGSEHQVCDNPRSAEMHMVFANTRGVASDRNDPDSGARFAVLGTVGEAGEGGCEGEGRAISDINVDSDLTNPTTPQLSGA